jgi:riboflavin transporter FmnP
MSGIDAPIGVAARPASDNSNLHDATRVFSKSVMISGVRCTLAYVIFPFLLPLLHVSDSVGPYIGIVIGAVAIWFNVLSIRRFWKSGHQWKWYMSALNVAVIAMLSVLFVQDVNAILS